MSLHSRRDFAKMALAALPGAAFLASSNLGRAAEAAKPNSKFAGVQIGLNVPYSFGEGKMSGETILSNCVELGISGVELRTQAVETFLGAPAELIHGKRNAAAVEQLRDWRKSVSMDKVKEFRAMYEKAGVLIEIVKVDGIGSMSEAEIDYAFTMAKTLGGRAISTEMLHKEEELKRVGSFADKHQFLVGYHGHATTKPADWEAAFALAKFNGANVDLGHFVAGNNISPVAFLKEHHERVTHVHLKDRKFNNGPNAPFGEGDTPIAEVLRLIRDSKWNIQATIEFEYKVPADSTRMKEIARAVAFCRAALI